jgi:RNA polymerase sigma factor (sigma-70 family)
MLMRQAGGQGACVAEGVFEQTSAIAAGDSGAFARFYRAWFDHCLDEASRCTGRDEQFCLDVVQEAMIRVIRHLPSLPNETALAAWLRVTIRSASVDLLRRDLRARRRDQSRARRHDDSEQDASHCARETRERIEWLRSQLADLPPEVARLLHMRFRLGWTLARIAKSLGLKTGAVDGRITRTIAHLRSTASSKEDRDV